MFTNVTVPTWVIFAALVVVSTGCYREPTHPAQKIPVGETDSGSSLGTVPDDSIHAGLGGGPGEIVEAREVEIGSMCLTAPDEWIRREPSSQFLITEFSLTKAEGDADDGRLTVSTAGGTVEDNVARWKGQFGDQPERESQEIIEVGDVKITLVDYAGTFNDSRGMFAPATPKAGYRMLGAVIPLDGQLFFIKGYGPEKTVAAHADKIRGFINSLKAPGEVPPQASSDTP